MQDRKSVARARVIAGISNFTDIGDVTTLANPEIAETPYASPGTVNCAYGVREAGRCPACCPRELRPFHLQQWIVEVVRDAAHP